jgi:peptidoglycan/LPS O-acetylase OafA/YrhL
MKRLAWIDALRGYAILCVFAAHLSSAEIGARGVQLFFVASAIALMYSRHPGLSAFFIRRFFRIAPMFWTAIAAFYFLALIIGIPPPNAAQLASAATFTFWIKPEWNGAAVPGSWSIACEVMFYLFFPFVAARISTLGASLRLLAFTVAVAVCSWPVLTWYAAWSGVEGLPSQHNFAFITFTSQAPCFALGVLAFMALEENRINPVAVGLFGLAAIAVLCCVPQMTNRFFLVWATAFAAVAYALGTGKFRFLVNPAICAVGLISYSAYFWHFFVLYLAAWSFPTLSRTSIAAIVVPVTLALSTLTYLGIERPMMRLGARIASQRAGTVVEAKRSAAL